MKKSKQDVTQKATKPIIAVWPDGDWCHIEDIATYSRRHEEYEQLEIPNHIQTGFAIHIWLNEQNKPRIRARDMLDPPTTDIHERMRR